MVDKVRAEQGPFDSDEALLLALFSGRDALDQLRRNRRPLDGLPMLRTPLRALFGELARRRGVRSVQITKATDLSYADAADIISTIEACPPGHASELERDGLRVAVAKHEDPRP
jgi:hypothetical protein